MGVHWSPRFKRTSQPSLLEKSWIMRSSKDTIAKLEGNKLCLEREFAKSSPSRENAIFKSNIYQQNQIQPFHLQRSPKKSQE
jgi:hypothetical protein